MPVITTPISSKRLDEVLGQVWSGRVAHLEDFFLFQ